MSRRKLSNSLCTGARLARLNFRPWPAAGSSGYSSGGGGTDRYLLCVCVCGGQSYRALSHVVPRRPPKWLLVGEVGVGGVGGDKCQVKDY